VLQRAESAWVKLASRPFTEKKVGLGKGQDSGNSNSQGGVDQGGGSIGRMW